MDLELEIKLSRLHSTLLENCSMLYELKREVEGLSMKFDQLKQLNFNVKASQDDDATENIQDMAETMAVDAEITDKDVQKQNENIDFLLSLRDKILASTDKEPEPTDDMNPSETAMADGVSETSKAVFQEFTQKKRDIDSSPDPLTAMREEAVDAPQTTLDEETLERINDSLAEISKKANEVADFSKLDYDLKKHIGN